MIMPLILAAALMQEAPPEHPPVAEEGPTDALVEAIRDNLTRIDELLLETADSDEQVAPSLASVRDMHKEVIRDLEELIKQARYRKSNQSSSSGGGESQDPSQGQPPPRESDGSRQPGSAEEPQPGEQEQQQGQQEQDQQQQQQQQRGERPEDGSVDDGTARKEDALGDPPPDPLGEFTRQDTDGRWGLLPPKLQERLMNLHVDDVPERYRTWLTAYIRSMQRLEQPASSSEDG